MHCYGCGRQSTRTDYCEWCKRPHGAPGQPPNGAAPSGVQPTQPLPPGMQHPPGMQPTQPLYPGAQPTTQMPPPAVTRRVALTGEVIEEPAAPPMPTQMMQPPGYQPSGYHGTPGPARVHQDIRLDFDEVSPTGERWEKALAFCLSLVALSMLFIHFVPNAILGVAYGDMFLLMFLLGATRAIPFFEDAMLDCGIMLGVAVIFGPLAALVVYLIVGAIKQECNGSIVTLLLVSILLPQLLAIALHNSVHGPMPILMLGLFNWLGFLAVFVGFLGWLCASFFRPLNE